MAENNVFACKSYILKGLQSIPYLHLISKPLFIETNPFFWL